MERYKLQLESIQAVCRQYEEDPNNFSRLLELIQKVGYCAEGAGCQFSCQQLSSKLCCLGPVFLLVLSAINSRSL
jgi:hypothetical protein